MSKALRTAWEGFLPRKAVVMARQKSQVEVKQVPSAPIAQPRTSINPVNGVSSIPTPPSSQIPPKQRPAEELLAEIASELQGCQKCKLCPTRKTVVVGEGNPRAEIMFIGEGPGEQEDLQGRPFVGKAGQLLDRMIAAISLSREQVFIANVVKCRPPGNRNPEPDEIQSCSPFLHRQIDAIRPKVIVALGKFAAQTLLETEERISSLRGKFHPYRGAKLMPTFHPAYLLRNPSSKREAWEDLQQVARELGIEIPKRTQG